MGGRIRRNVRSPWTSSGIRWTVALTTAAVALAVVASVATAHGLISLNVQVPPQDGCPADRKHCLDTVEPQPALHQGDEVDLYVWNDANESHRILVTTNASADPSHTDTPAGTALAEADVPVNSSRDAGSFQVPADADALYVWCDETGHEASGAWMRVPVEPATETSNASPAGPASAALALLAAALSLALGHRDSS